MAVQTDPRTNVNTYLLRVAELYADVRTWMASLEPSSQFSEIDVELNEEVTGSYKAKTLEVTRTGRPSIQLVPRGRYMIGAEGRVDVQSHLGREVLVWVRAGGPAVGFQFSSGGGRAPEELLGRQMFPGVAEGWAWSDEDRRELLHLDLAVFRDRILNTVGNA
jgi:hypothetical protein